MPRNPEGMLNLADKVYSKHVADGINSDLNNLDDTMYNWAKVGPTIPACLALHVNAEALKAAMEKTYRERDALLAVIDSNVKGSSTYLKGKYTNPKKLGEWGFEIDDTPPTPKKSA